MIIKIIRASLGTFTLDFRIFLASEGRLQDLKSTGGLKLQLSIEIFNPSWSHFKKVTRWLPWIKMTRIISEVLPLINSII